MTGVVGDPTSRWMWFEAAREQDVGQARVSRVLHAIEYLLGRLDRRSSTTPQVAIFGAGAVRDTLARTSDDIIDHKLITLTLSVPTTARSTVPTPPRTSVTHALLRMPVRVLM